MDSTMKFANQSELAEHLDDLLNTQTKTQVNPATVSPCTCGKMAEESGSRFFGNLV